MPLTACLARAHHCCVFAIHQSAPRPRTVVVAASGGRRWELVHVRLRDRLLARWRDQPLDERLADGQHAEQDRLTAVRAHTLTTPGERHKLAAGWETVLRRAAGPCSQVDPRVPLRRSAVLAAQDDIRRMIDLLRASTPVSARGVAIAHLLLTDGAGPLYDSGATAGLGATVRDAIRYLDPLTDLSTSIMDV